MPDRYHKPLFDSSVFLGHLNEEIANGIKRPVVFKYLWEKAKAGEFQVFISSIAIAEVYKTKGKDRVTDEVLDEFLKLIDEPFVEPIEVDRVVALDAHYLCRKYSACKLMPNDAIHLACALKNECDVLIAWDGPLTKVTHPKIRIEEPSIYDRSLFTESERATQEEIIAYEKKIGRYKEPEPVPVKLPGGGAKPAEGQAPAAQAAKAPAPEK